MPLIADEALDAGLNVVKAATILHICSAEPTVFATLNSLGTKTVTGTLTGPTDRTPSGRKITVPAITGGSVTGSGTAVAWALVDADSLLATGVLSASQAVTSGNTWSTTGSFDIGIPDAA